MKKILLIEDNTELRENTAEILELADFEVKTAKNGKEGVELVTKEAPDLIICDIMMPELDGFGVLHILSRKESTRNIPFIFMTAKAEKSDIRKGMNLGADDYLTKPFDDTELLDAVETRLGKADIAKQDYGQDLEALDSFISDVSSVHNLEDLRKERKVRTYKKKKDVFLEGDTPLYLLYVNYGKVKTYKTNEDGKELITGIYIKGDFFGYESLLEGEYGETATTLEESELVLIPKSDFLELINSNLEVSRKFVEILSKKVAKKEEQLLDLAYDTVRQRTAKALLDVYEKYGSEGEQTSLNISREDLANMVGTATETVIRVLSDFKEENLVLIEFGRIKITDLDKLNVVAKRNFAY
ncbi:MAG: response regulator [Cyclobacteriaceae bacterium]